MARNLGLVAKFVGTSSEFSWERALSSVRGIKTDISSASPARISVSAMHSPESRPRRCEVVLHIDGNVYHDTPSPSLLCGPRRRRVRLAEIGKIRAHQLHIGRHPIAEGRVRDQRENHIHHVVAEAAAVEGGKAE